MRVVMVLQHINFFRSMDTVVRELDARGHDTSILHGTMTKGPLPPRKGKAMVLGRGLGIAQADLPSVTTGYRPEPEESWQQRLRVGRQIINRSIYFREDHPSNRSVEGIEKGLSPAQRKWVNSRLGRLLLKQPGALAAWRRVERHSRPSQQVTSLLEEIRPDVVLVTPAVWPKSPIETDYLHAARKLGIPTVGFVSGWDNLTSKGTIHSLPDALIVWNEAMATEAVEFHDVPRDVIHVTGAPYLDRLFDVSPEASRAETCARLGCPDDRPYLVYLCSSRTIIADETHVVTELAEALARECPDEPPNIVVRPHPVSADTWEGYDHPGVFVYPKGGNQAETEYQWQEYYEQLAGASCVVGLNTSAFLEAVVADRPCLTIVSDQFYDQQGRTGHFRHLLDADFLEISGDIDEVAARTKRILGGADEKADGRARFKETFLRPQGVDRPAGAVVADTIERVAGREPSPARERVATPKPARSLTFNDASTGEPFFSIVIPTKNRPDELRNAIVSLLDQTFDDFEVVVCDNSDEPHAPQVAAVVSELADPRIRYVRTDGTLSMPDNWERAVAEARGTFVGILTDRSVFRRDALQVARMEIDKSGAKLLMWANDLYGRDPAGTSFKRRACTLQRHYHSADAMLGYFLHGHPKYSPKVIPKLMSGVCARSILDQIRASAAQRVCLPVSPDFTSGFLMLAYAEWVLAIDESLYVSCGTGNGSNFRQRNEFADRFRTDLGMEWRDMVDRMPSDACFSTATVLNDFMRVRELAPERLAHFELDRCHYYVGCLSDYVKTSRHGVLRADDLTLLLEALEQEPPEVRDTVVATRYYESAINATADTGKRATARGAELPPPLSFDTVFDAMTWDRANPRPPASESYLDLSIRFDQIGKSKSVAREKERARRREEKRALKKAAKRERETSEAQASRG